jgi:hypothetical protein
MMDAPFSITDLMGRWKCSKDSVKKMEQEGKIKRIPMFGTYYTAKSVYDLENYGEKLAISPSEYERLEKERDFWKDKCCDLESLIQKIHGITEGMK